MRMGLWGRWAAERAGREQASAFVRALLVDPPESDVQRLAEIGAHGDADHARWELRYVRRAAGMLAAQRDALDDRTASLVSSALARAVRRDPHVATTRRSIAARQFNIRLSAYADALDDKSASEGTGDRLGRVLLGFAGRLDPSNADLEAAGAIVTAFLAEASEALRRSFGAADLPEDVAPSAIRSGGGYSRAGWRRGAGCAAAGPASFGS
jgi:hypothetical protein